MYDVDYDPTILNFNNDVAHVSTPQWKKVVSKDTCNELCNLMESIILKADECSMKPIDTTEQLADQFTKGLQQAVFEYLRYKLIGW